MVEFTLQLERIEEGRVRATVLETDDMSGTPLVLWSCEANVSDTAQAQKDVMRATFNYLNKFIDLSQGGRA